MSESMEKSGDTKLAHKHIYQISWQMVLKKLAKGPPLSFEILPVDSLYLFIFARGFHFIATLVRTEQTFTILS